MDTLRWSSLLAHWNAGRGPLYARLGAAFQDCISGGHLTPGEQLPSERGLADLIQVSRSTVVAAYQELAAGGWVSRHQGSGTHVAAGAPRQNGVLALRSPVGSPVRGDAPASELDLTIAVPVLGEVQQARLRRASEGAFGESLYHPLGLPDLRATLAEMYARQGLPTRTQQIVVTTGAQQAISLIAGAILRRGDAALLETPTYFGAIDVFRAAGARLLGVPMEQGGIQVTAFQAQLGAGPRLAFLTPTFQNPTGAVMTADTRARLARMIAGAKLPTIEDDTLIDLSFVDGPPPPRLASLEPGAPVICVGSLSKLFWAGLRVGWMRLPEALAAPIIQGKTLADFGSSMPSQVIALNLLRDLPALRDERRREVLPARDLLVRLLREHLPDWTFQVPSGGQFLWARLPTRNATGFTHLARRYGVRLFPGASMAVTDLPDSFLRLPFTLPAEHLPEATKRLRLAWDSFQERGAAERLA
ncbi:PLP-dependent aminotransferase family protein [Deinococcus sp.]|uniref:aminotransferase-like domain-containing protein n=1 Tax=Deinococcus sp. TaxID=47478 RepID=UPI003C7ED31A